MTPQESYQIKRERVNVQLKMVQERLVQLDNNQQENPLDWSIVGSLSEVHEQLAKILNSIISD